MTGQDVDIDPRSRREAARWLVRRRLGKQTIVAERAFRRWLVDEPDNRRAYRLAEETWAHLPEVGHCPDYPDLLGQPTVRERIVAVLAGGPSRLLKSLYRGNPLPLRQAQGSAPTATNTVVQQPIGHLSGLRSRLYRPAAAAASVGLLLFAAIAISQFEWAPAVSNIPPQYATEKAEIRDLVLPDGSSVTLGARSRLTLDFSESVRRVSLTGGEAFFAVEKDAGRPFVVEAGTMIVRVLGTQFDVRRGPGKLRVSVLEGTVEVAAASDAASTDSVANAAIRKRLTAGEGLVADVAEPLAAAKTVRVARPGEWRKGRLVYDGVPLHEVVADVNRYFEGDVSIATPSLKSVRVTTAFRIDQIDQMLDSLGPALGIEVERQPGGEIILSRLHHSP